MVPRNQACALKTEERNGILRNTNSHATSSPCVSQTQSRVVEACSKGKVGQLFLPPFLAKPKGRESANAISRKKSV